MAFCRANWLASDSTIPFLRKTRLFSILCVVLWCDDEANTIGRSLDEVLKLLYKYVVVASLSYRRWRHVPPYWWDESWSTAPGTAQTTQDTPASLALLIGSLLPPKGCVSRSWCSLSHPRPPLFRFWQFVSRHLRLPFPVCAHNPLLRPPQIAHTLPKSPGRATAHSRPGSLSHPLRWPRRLCPQHEAPAQHSPAQISTGAPLRSQLIPRMAGVSGTSTLRGWRRVGMGTSRNAQPAPEPAVSR